jgi:hypothetical protein
MFYVLMKTMAGMCGYIIAVANDGDRFNDYLTWMYDPIATQMFQFATWFVTAFGR